MSYLLQYAGRRPALERVRAGVRVDERIRLNRPAFDGGAHVRIFVEDTSRRRIRHRRLPQPRLTLRIADCTTELYLDFGVDSAVRRENSLYKVDTLITALRRFRAALVAEADLYVQREHARRQPDAAA